jgi:hypothetical protein
MPFQRGSRDCVALFHAMSEFAGEGSPDLRVFFAELRNLRIREADDDGIFVCDHTGRSPLYRENGSHFADVVGCDALGEGLAVHHDVKNPGEDEVDLSVIGALMDDGGTFRNVQSFPDRGDAFGEAPVARHDLLFFEDFNERGFVVKTIVHARPSPKI